MRKVNSNVMKKYTDAWYGKGRLCRKECRDPAIEERLKVKSPEVYDVLSKFVQKFDPEHLDDFSKEEKSALRENAMRISLSSGDFDIYEFDDYARLMCDYAEKGYNVCADFGGLIIYSIDIRSKGDVYRAYSKWNIENIPSWIEKGKSFVEPSKIELWKDFVEGVKKDYRRGFIIKNVLELLQKVEEGKSWKNIKYYCMLSGRSFNGIKSVVMTYAKETCKNEIESKLRNNAIEIYLTSRYFDIYKFDDYAKLMCEYAGKGYNVYADFGGLIIYSIDIRSKGDVYRAYSKWNIENIPSWIEKGKSFVEPSKIELWKDFVEGVKKDYRRGFIIKNVLELLQKVEEGKSWEEIKYNCMVFGRSFNEAKSVVMTYAKERYKK